MVTDMLNVAYVIVMESVNIRILNWFPSDPIVILGIPMMPKGTHLHMIQRLPQMTHLLLHPLPKLLKFDYQRSLRSLNVLLVVRSQNNISHTNDVVIKDVVVLQVGLRVRIMPASIPMNLPLKRERHCWRSLSPLC
jgi:hypothetical protein